MDKEKRINLRNFLVLYAFVSALSLGLIWCVLELNKTNEEPPKEKGWVKIGEKVDDNYTQ